MLFNFVMAQAAGVSRGSYALILCRTTQPANHLSIGIKVRHVGQFIPANPAIPYAHVEHKVLLIVQVPHKKLGAFERAIFPMPFFLRLFPTAADVGVNLLRPAYKLVQLGAMPAKDDAAPERALQHILFLCEVA